jgi:heptaprenylglyceryl phosphate synthase
MADYTPVYSAGTEPFSATTSAAVTGGQILEWSGASTVAATTAASAKVCGVAAFDTASGSRVTVWPLDNVIHQVTSSGAITAGGGIESGAAGVAVAAATSLATAAAAGTLIGTAVTTAAGNVVRFQGRH